MKSRPEDERDPDVEDGVHHNTRESTVGVETPVAPQPDAASRTPGVVREAIEHRVRMQ